jgi:hypothetical protein
VAPRVCTPPGVAYRQGSDGSRSAPSGFRSGGRGCAPRMGGGEMGFSSYEHFSGGDALGAVVLDRCSRGLE